MYLRCQTLPVRALTAANADAGSQALKTTNGRRLGTSNLRARHASWFGGLAPSLPDEADSRYYISKIRGTDIMRLKVFILEGDWATTHEGSIARYLAYRLGKAIPSSDAQEEMSSRSASLQSTGTGRRAKKTPSPLDVWHQLHRNVWHQLHKKLSGQLIDVKVAEDASVESLIETIMRKRIISLMYHGADSIISRSLYESPTERLLRDQASLREEGLEDGDFVTLRIKHESGVGYMLLPGPDPEFIFRSICSYDGTAPVAGGFIWGALLYTDEDVNIASYVRRYFLELNALTGSIFRLFVVEKPTDWREAKKYWRQYLDADSFEVFAHLRWLFYKPYDRRQVYEIAERMGVRRDQLPCIALIYGNPPQNDLLVFPMQPAPTPKYFRSLFSHIYDTIGDAPGPGLDLERGAHYGFERVADGKSEDDRFAQLLTTMLDSTSSTTSDESSKTAARTAYWEALRSRYDQIMDAVTATSMSDDKATNYSFYGHTVFINHPGEGTVIHMKDDGDEGVFSE